MFNPEELLIIVPTYNESENIVRLVESVYGVMPGVNLLVVDDSSPDGTADKVRRIMEENPKVNLLVREGKDGLGKAYIRGFRWGLEKGYRYLMEMDADFSHDPGYLPDFGEAAEAADLVIGSRYISGVNVVNWPMNRLLISYCGNIAARIIAGVPVKDCTAGFKMFKREVLESIDLNRIDSSGYSFQVEMNYHVYKKGFRIKEIPIVFRDRVYGESKMSTGIIREALMLLWKLRLHSIFSRVH
ncbi:MAG: polyprenol monophosphomannose synthase [Chitinivibrionales bacterium]